MGERHPIASLVDSPALVERCAAILRSGGIVLFPTDTVYGLGARADSPEAVDRVYALKKRPRDLSIPVLLADPEHLGIYGSPSATALTLAEKYWPGALTIVVHSKGKLAPNLSDGPSLGFRCPDHDALRSLIRALGVPLAGTSANRSGQPEAHTLAEVTEDIQKACDLILDGGTLPGGRPSTVVDCTEDIPKILRHGDVDISVA